MPDEQLVGEDPGAPAVNAVRVAWCTKMGLECEVRMHQMRLLGYEAIIVYPKWSVDQA